MKKYLCMMIGFILIFSVFARAADTADITTDTTAETTTETVTQTAEEITEDEPTEADDSEDIARTFMNINIYMFFGAVALFLICTVIYIVMKVKQKKKNSENND